MAKDWIIERDARGNKLRRQLTDEEQAKRDNRPPRVPKPDPDIEGAIRHLINGNASAAQAAMDKMK